MSLGYLVVYLISKKNGAEGVGFYSVVNQALIVLGIVATWGTGTSTLRYIGQFNNDADRGQLRHIYRTLLRLVIPVSLAAAVFAFIFAPLLARHFFGNPAYEDALRLTAVVLPLFALNSIGVEFIRGLKKLKVSEFIRSVSRPLLLSIALLFLWEREVSNFYLICLFLGAIVVNTVLSNGYIWRELSKLPLSGPSKLNKGEFMKTSSPMMVSGVIAALMSALPLFMIDFFDTTENAGVFSLAVRLSLFISIVLTVVNTISAPKFAALYWENKRQDLQRLIRQSTKLMFWGAFFFSLGVILLANPILEFFGKEFTAGKWTLIVLVIGQFINAATGSVGLLLNMSGHQRALRDAALIALVIQVILLFVLIPWLGIVGGAIASATSGAIWNLIAILYVRTKMQLRTYYIPFIR